MNIPDVMRSISEVLTTAEELLADDEQADREVSLLVMSFLKTLLVDLDKVRVEQGPTGVRPRRRPDTTHVPAKDGKDIKVGRTARAIPNKYDSSCVRCDDKELPAGEGFVLPAESPNAKKKWFAFCDVHYQKEIA